MEALEPIAAVATRSPKTEGNEDRVLAVLSGDRTSGAGVVLCDGVGSSDGAAIAAERFGAAAVAHMEAGGDEFGVWGLTWALREVSGLRADGKTTLIALGAESSGFVSHLMIGNGSVIEVAATPVPNGSVRLLWTDVVLPQIDWREGRPALASFLPAPAAHLRVARGAHFVSREARAYVVCSDGIATVEDREEGTAPDDGSTWREVPAGIVRVVEALTALWPSILSDGVLAVQEALTAALEGVLDGLEQDPGLDDDASLGIVVLRPAVAGVEGES